MPVFLAGAALAFWWLFKNGVGSPKPAQKKPVAPKMRYTSDPEAAPAKEAGVGEDYVPEGQKIAPPPKRPAPAPAPKSAPAAPVEDKKNLSLPARKGGKGSFDDDLPDGIGTDDVDLTGFGGDDDVDLDEEEA